MTVKMFTQENVNGGVSGSVYMYLGWKEPQKICLTKLHKTKNMNASNLVKSEYWIRSFCGDYLRYFVQYVD